MNIGTKLMIAGAALGATIGGIALYNRNAEPKFLIRSYSPSEKKGIFEFGGTANHFDLDSAGSYGTGKHWGIMVYPKNGNVYFDLYKDGQFIRNLQVI